MGLIELASRNSVWRGMDYYEAKRVLTWVKSGQYIYDGIVSGSEEKVYHVHIDTEHPRKSVCDCAFAKGRRVICKHMIALYFTAKPETVQSFKKQIEDWEAEEEERERQYYEELKKYVKSLSKKELQEELFYALAEVEEMKSYR